MVYIGSSCELRMKSIDIYIVVCNSGQPSPYPSEPGFPPPRYPHPSPPPPPLGYQGYFHEGHPPPTHPYQGYGGSSCPSFLRVWYVHDPYQLPLLLLINVLIQIIEWQQLRRMICFSNIYLWFTLKSMLLSYLKTQLQTLMRKPKAL